MEIIDNQWSSLFSKIDHCKHIDYWQFVTITTLLNRVISTFKIKNKCQYA